MKEIVVPEGLKEAGQQFWVQVMSEYQIEEAHDLTRLKLACQCLDEIKADREVLEAEGRYITDRFHQQREHPAKKAMRDNQALFCRILRELRLDLTTGPENRVPRQY